MKKIALVLLSLLLLASFCACANSIPDETTTATEVNAQTTELQAVPPKPEEVIPTFQAFLDGEGFDENLSEGFLINQIIPKYTYEGKTIDEYSPGAFWDGTTDQNGNASYGFQTINNNEGRFEVYYSYSNGEKIASFHSKVPLQGLYLPFGISFGDSMAEVAEKMGLDFDPSDFTADNLQDGSITLLSMNGASLIYSDYRKVQRDDFVAIDRLPYYYRFSETQSLVSGTGTYYRSLLFGFNNDETGLSELTIKVNVSP